jgi:hypothetical protein
MQFGLTLMAFAGFVPVITERFPVLISSEPEKLEATEIVSL